MLKILYFLTSLRNFPHFQRLHRLFFVDFSDALDYRLSTAAAVFSGTARFWALISPVMCRMMDEMKAKHGQNAPSASFDLTGNGPVGGKIPFVKLQA